MTIRYQTKGQSWPFEATENIPLHNHEEKLPAISKGVYRFYIDVYKI